jgi:hypothetical protein
LITASTPSTLAGLASLSKIIVLASVASVLSVAMIALIKRMRGGTRVHLAAVQTGSPAQDSKVIAFRKSSSRVRPSGVRSLRSRADADNPRPPGKTIQPGRTSQFPRTGRSSEIAAYRAKVDSSKDFSLPEESAALSAGYSSYAAPSTEPGRVLAHVRKELEELEKVYGLSSAPDTGPRATFHPSHEMTQRHASQEAELGQGDRELSFVGSHRSKRSPGAHRRLKR